MQQRRPTRLDTPLPGSRCPGCWLPIDLALNAVSFCSRCFAFVTCSAPGHLQRIAQADLAPLLTPADRLRISTDQAYLIMRSATAWRSLPRTPSRPRPQVR